MWDLHRNGKQKWTMFSPGATTRGHTRIVFNICCGGTDLNTLCTISMDRQVRHATRETAGFFFLNLLRIEAGRDSGFCFLHVSHHSSCIGVSHLLPLAHLTPFAVVAIPTNLPLLIVKQVIFSVDLTKMK